MTGHALPEACLQEFEESISLSVYRVSVKGDVLTCGSMLVDINMNILIPLLRITLKEGNDKPNLIHVFAKSLTVVVELRLDIKNKPVQIIYIAIKGTNIDAIWLVWSPLFLERFQLFS